MNILKLIKINHLEILFPVSFYCERFGYGEVSENVSKKSIYNRSYVFKEDIH